MKHLLSVSVFTAVLALTLQARATLFFTEHFAYGNGNLKASGIGDTVFLDGDGPTTQIIVSNNAALTEPVGFAAASGSGLVITNGNGKKMGARFNGTTGAGVAAGSTLMASFLINVQALPATAGLISYLHTGSSSTSPSLGVFLDTTGRIGIGKRSSTGTYIASPITLNQTHLIVVRYNWLAGNDTVELWVDPSSSYYDAGAAPPADVTAGATITSDATSVITDFYVVSINSTVARYNLDEIRVGTTWADVVPSGSCLSATINSNPADTNILAGATATFNVVLGGSAVTNQWQVSTDNGSTWNNVASGTGGNSPSYTTAATTAANNNNKFRCLAAAPCDGLTQTSSVATLTVVCDTVNISAGPVSQTSYSGYTATFNVAATGTARTYQWQLSTDNGASWNAVGTSSSNYTTATLGTADNGSKFRCVVGTPCDSASLTSAVATLTIIDPVSLSFRSATSGDWASPATWEYSTNGNAWTPSTATPFYGNSNITVRAGHVVTVTAPVSVDDLTVAAGGELDVNGTTLTFNDGAAAVDANFLGTLQVLNATNGALVTGTAALNFGNGSHYVWGSQFATAAVPTATWADGSVCEVANGNNNTPTGLTQSFYDFFWSRTSTGLVNLAGTLQTVRHNLTMRGSGSAAASVRFLQTGITCNVSVGNDFIADQGYVTFSGGSVSNTVLNLYVGGNFVVNAGAILDSRTANAATPVGSEVNIWFTNTAATQYFTNNGAVDHTGDVKGCPVYWHIPTGVTVVAGQGNFSVTNAYQGLSDTVIVDGTLKLNGNQVFGITGGSGALTINSGGVLEGSGTAPLASNLKIVNYGGTLSLPGLPTNLGNGDGFKLFDATGYTGAFTTISPSTTPTTGFSWDTTQLTVSGYLYAGSSSVPVLHFTERRVEGGNFVLFGTGGPANGSYSILTSTSPGLPMGSWSVLASGLSFDGGGNFSYTNALGAGPLFFRVVTP